MKKAMWWSLVRVAGFAVGNLALGILWIVSILNPAYGRGASYQFIFLFVLLVTVVLGSMNVIANKRLLVSDIFFFIFSFFGFIAAVLLIFADKASIAATFAVLAVLGLIASKVGVFIWTVILLPALNAIPAAIGGAFGVRYLNKVLDRGEKKKSTPETPTPAIPPAEPAPVKRTRKRAAPPPTP